MEGFSPLKIHSIVTNWSAVHESFSIHWNFIQIYKRGCSHVILSPPHISSLVNSHEIKRRLLLGREVMTNLDSILKSRDITFPTKGCLVKAVFPVAMYGCESWTVKKAEHKELMLLNCGVGIDSWESLRLQGDPTSPFWRRSALGFLWKERC